MRKFRAGNHASAEERNVLGLVLTAHEAKYDAVVFTRDRDGDVERERDLEHGIERSAATFSALHVVGGVAVENIEAWILVLLGVRGEAVPKHRSKAQLAEDHGVASLEHKVDVIAEADLSAVPPGSLRTWLDRAAVAFAAPANYPHV